VPQWWKQAGKWTCRPERVVRVGGSCEDEVDGVAGGAMGGVGVTAGLLSEVGKSASLNM
jgi:hypothetical protein